MSRSGERLAVSRLLSRRRAEAAAHLSSAQAQQALAAQGTPLLLLDPARVVRQYRRLQRALPFVRFHYAVKVNPHAAVLSALAAAGSCFDVATTEELLLLEAQGIAPRRIIHTHPIKKPVEIWRALEGGIRTFVVDNETEIDKFAGLEPAAQVLVRLAYRSPKAGSDLSSKFGVRPGDAARLVAHADAVGVRVAGFSFHVGSQLDDPARFAAATAETLDLMDDLERARGIRFDMIDIGGGFPIAYDAPVASIERIAAPLRRVLEPVASRYDIIAEPGRVLVADAMTLVTSVVGISDRPDGRWCFLDDGLYGSYSNVLTEDVHPPVFAAAELRSSTGMPRRSVTLGGPTCDSTDVIARGAMLPDLWVGDLLVSPVMGAYTTVTATRFNGRELTPVVVIDARVRVRSVETQTVP